jgi:hypothetical protein
MIHERRRGNGYDTVAVCRNGISAQRFNFSAATPITSSRASGGCYFVVGL